MCKEFSKTRFITVPITQTLNVGIPIGQGGCAAVRLKLNTYIRNTRNYENGGNLPFFIYYGDSQTQECELQAGQSGGGKFDFNGEWTPRIYCENLEEVFIRYGGKEVVIDWPDTAYVQVMIYN